MWLPEPLYRSLPIVYAIMGALFILGALYLDLSEPLAPFYFALGLFSLGAAVVVAVWRYRSTAGRRKVDTDESPLA